MLAIDVEDIRRIQSSLSKFAENGYATSSFLASLGGEWWLPLLRGKLVFASFGCYYFKFHALPWVSNQYLFGQVYDPIVLISYLTSQINTKNSYTRLN